MQNMNLWINFLSKKDKRWDEGRHAARAASHHMHGWLERRLHHWGMKEQKYSSK